MLNVKQSWGADNNRENFCKFLRNLEVELSNALKTKFFNLQSIKMTRFMTFNDRAQRISGSV